MPKREQPVGAPHELDRAPAVAEHAEEAAQVERFRPAAAQRTRRVARLGCTGRQLSAGQPVRVSMRYCLGPAARYPGRAWGSCDVARLGMRVISREPRRKNT